MRLEKPGGKRRVWSVQPSQENAAEEPSCAELFSGVFFGVLVRRDTHARGSTFAWMGSRSGQVEQGQLYLRARKCVQRAIEWKGSWRSGH